MVADQPHVTGQRDRLTRRFGERFFLFRLRVVAAGAEQRFQFLVGGADELEVEPVGLQVGEFRGQDFIIPSRVIGKLVVHDDVRPPHFGCLDRREGVYGESRPSGPTAVYIS